MIRITKFCENTRKSRVLKKKKKQNKKMFLVPEQLERKLVAKLRNMLGTGW